MVSGCELVRREATGERGLNQLRCQLLRHDDHRIIIFQVDVGAAAQTAFQQPITIMIKQPKQFLGAIGNGRRTGTHCLAPDLITLIAMGDYQFNC